MGTDAPDIRKVIHAGVPGTLERMFSSLVSLTAFSGGERYTVDHNRQMILNFNFDTALNFIHVQVLIIIIHLFLFQFNAPVNTIEVISSRSAYLTALSEQAYTKAVNQYSTQKLFHWFLF